VTWAALLGLAAAAYAMKAIGPVALGHRQLPPAVLETLGMLSIPLLAALVAVQTFGGAHRLVVDARVPAMAVAAVLVWRRAPFPVVLAAAAVTAALLRL
jgi:branched-subunit amino acid transport protein